MTVTATMIICVTVWTQVCVECGIRTRGGVPPRAKVLLDMATAELALVQFTTPQAHSAIGNLSAGESGLLERMGVDATSTRRGSMPRRAKELPRLDVESVDKAKRQRQVRGCVVTLCMDCRMHVSVDMRVRVRLAGVLGW